MNDPERESTVHPPDASPEPAERPEAAASSSPKPVEDAGTTKPERSAAVTGADDLDEAAPSHRSDPLAAGVAIMVMAALLACATIVLIAAGNA